MPGKKRTDWEKARLAALDRYEILDTPTERDFDEIARLASDICGTPIAVVNFVAADRQFFKAEVGLGVRATPLESSFCAQAILEDEFLEIPDMTRDARFDGNPLVRGAPHLRFYAGALLKTDEGLPIGTVCVLDHAPRELDELQRRTLRVLARQVMARLELRQALREKAREVAVERRLGSRRKTLAKRLEAENRKIRQEEERHRVAQDAGGIGIFEVDIVSGVVEVSEEFCRIFGLPLQRTYPATALEDRVVEDDSGMRSNGRSRRDGTAQLDVEYRIQRQNDGAVRWIARRARLMTDAGGEPLKMVGVVIDVTDARRRDSHAAALLRLGDRLREVGAAGEVSRIAVEMLAKGLAVERTGFATIDRDAGAFAIEHDWTAPGTPSLAGPGGTVRAGASIERLLAGETLAVSDVAEADWLGADAAMYSAIGVRSFIEVPMLDQGRLIGVLFAQESQPRRWTQDETTFAWSVADRTYAALAKSRAEAEQVLLNHELGHRLKNTLAMVQAIASQTLRGFAEKEALTAFTSRLRALGSAHEVLLHQNFDTARLRAVVDKVVAPHAPGDRLDMSGPDLAIGSKAGLSLSLILHELATNAVKYGALSNDTGRVAIDWTVDRDEGDPLFTLTWRESGGPPVVEPESTGFGSRLIRTGICGTRDVSKRYDPEGFVAVFRAPLVLLQEKSL